MISDRQKGRPTSSRSFFDTHASTYKCLVLQCMPFLCKNYLHADIAQYRIHRKQIEAATLLDNVVGS